MIDQIIDEIKETGILRFKIEGEAKAVFDFLAMMGDTEPLDPEDEKWWWINLLDRRN
ncbi:hypothetical protein LCGC14_2815620 [marine sediment metagenome]|uniref:Uncharacterized protein n=1 Tax=marine sediment metagenome TaxID=412755 RepID=A0A0F8YIJ3_9ZZZZ